MMHLPDWLRVRKPVVPTPPMRDPLQETLRQADEATAEALEAINISRRQRGVSPLSWEDLFAPAERERREC